MNHFLEIFQFLGPFHPIVLHFPIAFLLLAAVTEFFMLLSKEPWLKGASWLLLISGATTAVLAASLGYLLSQSGDYDAETMAWHMRFGIGVAVLSVLSIVFKAMSRRRGGWIVSLPYRLTLSLSVAAVFAAGHFGGTLTHGQGYLTRAAPVWMKTWLVGAEAGPVLAADRRSGMYANSIEPILSKYCSECHGDVKQNGGLRLDDDAWAYRGGESGVPAIVPGNAMRSEIVRRLTLLPSHKNAMPPYGKARPDPEQLVALISWIQLGASWSGEALAVDLLAEGVAPVSDDALAPLRAAGVIVVSLSEKNSLLRVDAANARISVNELFRMLAPLEKNVTWLDLSGLPLTQENFKSLGAFAVLTRLGLANTPIGDAEMQNLSRLSNLVSLNVVGTNVTNAGLTHLVPIKELRKLYVWRTSIDQTGMAKLKESLPDLEVAMPVYKALEDRLASSSTIGVDVTKGQLSHYRTLTAIGPTGEHYSIIGGIKSPPGVTKFTMLARQKPGSSVAQTLSKIRIQIWDGKSQGLIADYDLNSGESNAQHKGLLRSPQFSIESEGLDWKRIKLTAVFASADRTLYIQLLDKDGNSRLEGDGRGIDIKDMKLH